MDTSDRMRVNAAIECLILGENGSGEAAKLVIEFGHTLTESSSTQIDYRSHKKSGGGHITGFTAEQGDVTLKEPEKDELRELSFGVKRERIGHYRLWKERAGLIHFCHFWKSDLTTQSINDNMGPETYYLCYDPKSLEPIYCAVKQYEVVFRFWLGVRIEILRGFLVPIHGEIKKQPRIRHIRITG